MSYKYRLKLSVLAQSKTIDISAEEYIAIKVDVAAIGIVSYIEEEWDNVVQNYIELETEMLKAAVHNMVVRSVATFDDFHDVRRLISRRMATVLSSCKAYLDHTPGHLGRLGLEDLPVHFKAATNKVHAADFSYRFMEALRNHAQHHGVPMHSASFGARWIEVDGHEKDLSRYTAAGRVDLDKLRKNPKFKKTILNEIDPDVRYLDVATLAREYLEGLSEVHETIRGHLSVPYAGWKQAIGDILTRYRDINDGRVIGLTAQKLTDKDDLVEQVHIFDDLYKYVDLLIRRNGSLVNLRRRFVSSEPIKPNQPNRLL